MKKRSSRLAWAAGLALLAQTGVAHAGSVSAQVHRRSPRLQWARHASTVDRGRTAVLVLRRPVRSACDLTIGAAGVRPRTYAYARGTGQVQFAIRPPRQARSGTWALTATCLTLDHTQLRATTHLVVTGARRASGFLVGRTGPSYEVPVTFGRTGKTPPAPTGGRGGDPGNDYPWAHVAQDSGVDPWGEDYRECTSFVAWALHSRNNYNMPFHDNAYNWGIDAQRLGIPVNHTPAVGSVAWEPRLPGHYWGHVMWVAAVNGQMVTVEEYNEYGNGTYDERTFNVNSEPYQYIHFKDLSYSPPSVPVSPPTTAPPSATAYAETAGSVVNTWTDYTDAGGTEGPSLAAGQTVQVSCKLQGFAVADGNTWWYQVASSPWNGGFYVSADAFYNDGATSGSLTGTPFVDNSVPTCVGSATKPSPAPSPSPSPTPSPSPSPTPSPSPSPSPTTYNETAGSVAHTWTNYTNAGGSQGPSIGSGQTVAIACRLTGFAVSDGNSWWYRVASAPWSNSYYVSADAFYNNGRTSGSLSGTPFFDPSVPTC